jgi:hypothetical protein
VSRRRASSVAIPLGAGALLAVCLAMDVAAQTAPDDPANVLRPEVDGDPRNAQTFRRFDGVRARMPFAITNNPQPPRRPDQTPPGQKPKFEVPKFGNRAAFGAGKTGFNSQAVLRRVPNLRGLRLSTQRVTLPSAPLDRLGTAVTSPITRPNLPRPATLTPDRTDAERAAALIAARHQPSIDQNPRLRPRVELEAYEPLGLRAGGFVLKPAIDVSGGYDTNPARANGGKGSSLVIVSPELLVRSDWSRHELRADLRGSYIGYPGYDQQPKLDRPNVDARVFGRVDVTHETRLDGEGRLLVGTDNPGSPNIQAGLAKLPIFTTVGSTAGVTQRFSRWEVALKGTLDRVDYRDSPLTDGSIASNADRNFNQYGGQLRASYELLPGVKPFAEVAADTRIRDLEFDHFGVQRSSRGQSARVGTTFEPTRLVTGEIAVGYLTRSYKDPTLPDLTGLLVDGSLIWSASALTTATLTARTTADESTTPGTAGVFRRDVGMQVDHAFRRWLIGTAKLGYGLDLYEGSPREDNRYSASLAVTYKLTRTVQIKGEFRQDWLQSNQPATDYNASTMLLGMRLQR